MGDTHVCRRFTTLAARSDSLFKWLSGTRVALFGPDRPGIVGPLHAVAAEASSRGLPTGCRDGRRTEAEHALCKDAHRIADWQLLIYASLTYPISQIDMSTLSPKFQGTRQVELCSKFCTILNTKQSYAGAH